MGTFNTRQKEIGRLFVFRSLNSRTPLMKELEVRIYPAAILGATIAVMGRERAVRSRNLFALFLLFPWQEIFFFLFYVVCGSRRKDLWGGNSLFFAIIVGLQQERPFKNGGGEKERE